VDKDPGIYVRHTLEAIANIEADTAGYDVEKFRSDRRARHLVEGNLEIVSEASRRLPAELRDQEPSISWQAIAGIGNILRHDYHETYPTVLWETCKKDPKPLKCLVLHPPPGFFGFFRERFNRAIEAGELPRGSAADFARFCVVMIQGLALQAKAGSSRKELHRVVDLYLETWPPRPLLKT
jgi:uncharacterized protein with HEPN domain